MESNSKLPEFVRMSKGSMSTALRLRKSKSDYWRDAGRWGVGFKFRNGKLYSVCKNKELKYLDNIELTEITEQEYAQDNGEYYNKNYND